METGKVSTIEEQLEYESDDDDFEVVYVESQSRGNESVNMSHVEDITGNETEYFEVDPKRVNSSTGEEEEHEFSDDDEEFEEGDAEDDFNGEGYYEDGQSRKDEENDDYDTEGKVHEIDKGETSGPEILDGYERGEVKGFGDGELSGSGEAGGGIYEGNEPALEKYGNEESDFQEKLPQVTTAYSNLEGVGDPFNDDELIEYVENPDDAKDRLNETTFEFTGEEDRQESTKVLSTLRQLPIYLDFCDLVSDKEKDLGNAWLDEEIKVDFDFMKLYPPDCEEDEMYAEFDSLYEDLDECIGLNFSDIFQNIRDVIRHCHKIRDLGADVDIHLTFADLLNFTITSDSVSSGTLKLEDVLFSYERLKEQSPNADLHKFLLLRVWLSRNPLGQFDILKNASLNGYRLENLSSLVSRKRIGDWHEEEPGPAKRVKVDSDSKTLA